MSLCEATLGSSDTKLDSTMQWFAPPESYGSMMGRFVAYPIGKVLLRVLTLGRYPPENEKHNDLLVIIFPWVFFCVVALIVYS
jgi:hypothetical protein